MLDNLNVGKKLFLLSSAILMLLLITMLSGFFGISKTLDSGKHANEIQEVAKLLATLEIDHLVWADSVSKFLGNDEIKSLNVQVDHTLCRFGKWYYGSERKRLEHMVPEVKGVLQQLEQPHRDLHASVNKIQKVYAQGLDGNKQRSKEIFYTQTVLHLGEVRDLLHEVRNLAEASVEEHIAENEQTAALALTLNFGGGIAALLVGILFSVLIGRSLSTPLRRTATMLDEMEKGHLDTRLNLQRTDEIGHMAATMDRFADSLQREVIEALKRLASGDLTFEVAPRDEQDQLRGSLKQLNQDLNQIMEQVLSTSTEIVTASGQVANSSQELSQGATESAASLEEISASLNQTAAQIRQNADNSTEANKLSGQARNVAQQGSEYMQGMVVAMNDIDAAGQNISKIIKTIDEIAFQTNLLALNAAVEAARAGQHGKGFAVVAEEVRNLAGRSAKAAAETSNLIQGTVEKTAHGNTMAEQTSTALDEIVNEIAKVTHIVAEISSASAEQSIGVAEINQGVAQIDSVTQQNTASAEQSAAAAEELAGQAESLKEMLQRFKLKKNSAISTQPRHPQQQQRHLPEPGSWGSSAGDEQPAPPQISFE